MSENGDKPNGHEKEAPSYRPAHRGQTAPLSYKPNHASPTNTGRPNDKENSSDQFDDLIGQIMRQQNNVRQQNKGLLSIKTDRATKIRIGLLLVVLFGSFQLLKQQESNKETFARLRANQEQIKSNPNRLAEEDEQRKLFEDLKKQGEKRQKEAEKLYDEVEKMAQAPQVTGTGTRAKSFAALLIDSQKLNGWEALMTCAGQSSWSGYHSQNFIKLADNLFLMMLGDNLIIYTPNFVGKQKIFSGVFWQSYLHRLMRIVGRDFRHRFPVIDVAIPYPHYLDKSKTRYLPGAFYLRLRRRDGIVGDPQFRLGQTLPEINNRRFRIVGQYSSLWQAGVKPAPSRMTKLFQDEIGRQISRYEKNKSKPWSLNSTSAFGNYDHINQERRIISACQVAGKKLKLNSLNAIATRAQKLHLKDRSTLWFPRLASYGMLVLEGQRAPFHYQYPLRYIGESLRTCLLEKQVPTSLNFSVGLTISAAGGATLKSVTPNIRTARKGLSQCMQKVLPGVVFPTSPKKKPRHLKVNLSYQ